MIGTKNAHKLSVEKLELFQQLLAEAGIEAHPTEVIFPRENRNEAPLSFAQSRLWFLDQLVPGSSFYNISRAMRIKSKINIPAFEQTLNEIVRRHESLRTGCRAVDGQPVQVVAPRLHIEFPVIDLSRFAENERELEMKRVARCEAQRSFDFSKPPLLRVSLLQMSEQECVVLMTIHHIVSDAWSMQVMTREISEVYEAFTGGRPSSLEELKIQYGDYAAWQRQWAREEVLEQQLGYWTKQLAGDLPVLQLPTDRPRSAVQTNQGAQETLSIPASLTNALKDLSRIQGVTLFVTLVAAFKVLLFRYTGQDDVIVGSPIANRNLVETKDLIGFFANILALRTDLGGDPGFQELLNREKDVVLGAIAHQELPFEKLVESLQPERSLSHAPIFQVAFSFDNVPAQELASAAIELDAIDVDFGTGKFELTAEMWDTGEGLRLSFDYNTRLFEAATIRRMARHYRNLLESIIGNPQQRISSLMLLTESERHQLLVRPKSVEVSYDVAGCIHQLFEAQVERLVESEAVAFGEVVLTYADLNQRANQIAHYLRASGIGPESIVGICLERSLDMVVSILAILKAGGAYLPLDPDYPRERLAFMLEDSQAVAVLTEVRLRDLLTCQAETKIICLDEDREAILSQSAQNLVNRATADNAAYLIYTSGSTGKPKGVVVTHRNVVRLFGATMELFHFSEDDVWTLFHSYAFDFSVWEIWGALLYGGRLVVVPFLVSRSPDRFYEMLVREKVTVLNQTPSAFRQLIRAEQEYNGQAKLSLRAVIFGGEALELQSLKPWIAGHGDRSPKLVNMYGITETTVHVTHRVITTEDVEQVSGSVIGEPIRDLELYILDDHLQPVPYGVAGEVYVGGAGLARGYLNRVDLTAERFIPGPFGEVPGARLYRTGDLARWLADGDVEYLGRIDDQVKIRGFRIELGEIEAVLTGHPSVSETVVLVQEEEPGHKRLVACVVPSQGSRPDVDELRRFVREKLPAHMTPQVVMVESIPLTPTGKVDRSALQACANERQGSSEQYELPQSETEEILAAIWSQALGIEQVGLHDNFFSMGGDSIRSVQVVALAKSRKLALSLQMLFQRQTIRELAAELKIVEAGSASYTRTEPFSLISEECRLNLPGDVEDAYPLTALQAGMLFHMQCMPDSPLYHNINSYHLEAPYNREAFKQAVQRVVYLHPILRTSFNLHQHSEPIQLVHKRATLPISVCDIRHLSAEQQESELDDFVEIEKARRFDLSQPPLLRFHVHLRSDSTFQFTLTEFHPIFDGWSLQSTLADVFENYFALLKDGVLPYETPPSVSFRDFVQLERMTQESEECRRYWAGKLADCTITELPQWAGAPEDADGPRIRNENILVPADVLEGLRRLARSAAVPLKSVLLAAHLKAMSVISGQTDIITGLVCNGRPEELDGERIRGLFLNTVPFRLNASEGSWIDLVRKTFETERELLPFRRYPLAALQRTFGGQPLFDVVFNYVHYHVLEGLLRSGEVKVIGGGGGSEETNYTITSGFMLDVISSELMLILGYDSTKLSRNQIIAIGNYYGRILSAMAKDFNSRHEHHCFLSSEETQRILINWNDTRSAYQKDRTIHQLFEARAETAPQALAVSFGGNHLSYAELNLWSNRLAHYLRAKGVGPEVRVAICMERSMEMIVGLLAILKAGGAYVPLDPTYPRQRLAFMLEDAGAHLVLTQQHLVERLPSEAAEVVLLDEDRQQIARYSQHNLASGATPDNLAYVIYTSGSTGLPKGVGITQGGLLNLVDWHQRTYGLKPSSRATQLAGLSFDASVWEIWPYLAAGASLHIADDQTRSSPASILRWLKDEAITISFLPTPLAELALEQEWPEGMALKYLLTGGDKLHKTQRKGAEFELVNHYGPTENTVVTTAAVVREESEGEGAPPIGKPISNTRVYVLDANLQPVPIGACGELYISGEGLARGYCNRPEMTGARFIPNPFEKQTGGRMYKTGDLVRYLPEGDIEFIGRNDQQVKIRGLRIELGEIEAVLASHPAVREAVVTPKHDSAGEQHLLGYIVAEQPAPSAKELREYLRDNLPEYMIPARIVTLDAMPLTLNGKVDKQALPEPDEQADEVAAYVAPQSELEEKIASVWREVLQVERVGVHDNFFDTGGHSLRLLAVRSKLAAVVDAEVTIVDLFEHPTVSSLAGFISKRQTASDGSGREPRVGMAEKLREGKRRQRQRLVGIRQTEKKTGSANEQF